MVRILCERTEMLESVKEGKSKTEIPNNFRKQVQSDKDIGL